jgi:hypothetical protein
VKLHESKDAKRLSIKSPCLNNATVNLWFGFESSNWIMKKKIILEVVPWVDTKRVEVGLWRIENLLLINVKHRL